MTVYDYKEFLFRAHEKSHQDTWQNYLRREKSRPKPKVLFRQLEETKADLATTLELLHTALGHLERLCVVGTQADSALWQIREIAATAWKNKEKK